MNEKRHLLAHVLNQSLSATYFAPPLTLEQQALYQNLCDRLDQGEPLAYLINSAEFWSLPLKITPDVLIPRPETELLIEQALALFNPELSIQVLELGTGSGAISIALKKERPDWEIIAIDKSPKALEVARHNADTHETFIQFFESDWFNQVNQITQQKFDLIISNPPYIPDQDPHFQGSIKYEPLMALASGSDGLKDLKIIISKSREFLKPKGLLLLEHGYDQGFAVQELLRLNHYQNIKTMKDLFKNDRVSFGERLI
jgi:release factor glutamine methyltransferase